MTTAVAEYTPQQLNERMDALSSREQREVEAILRGDLIPLAEFARQGWHVVEQGRAYLHNWHIDAIAEHLEALIRGWIRNLIINIPPRHMKSLTTAVFWPVWTWTWLPEFRWLFASYSASLSVRDSLKCRRLIQSPWYQKRWGHVFELADDQNQKTRFENSKTGYRLAVGVGGSSTGEGGDGIVVDDPHNMFEVESELLRQTVLEWWDGTMSTRGNDPETVIRVIMMQRGHEEDLTGHVLDQMKVGGERYEHLCLPAEYEPTTYVTGLNFKDPRTERGELIWPERFSRKALDSLKVTLGSRKSAAQLQQRPSPAGGNIFKEHWWGFWYPPDTAVPPVRVRMPDGSLHECALAPRPLFETEIQSWDMTFKDTKSSAFVAGQVWGKNGANKYLLDQVRGKMDMPRTVTAVIDLTEAWPNAKAKIVEDKANGPAVIQTLKNKIPGLIAENPKGDKVARAHAVTPSIEAGNVFLPHPHIAPWVNDFIEEASSFPNGKYKDQVDAMTQAVSRLEEKPKKKKARAW